MNQTLKVMFGFIAGAAVGGVLGLLLAPDKGSETRRRIIEKGSEIGDSIANFGDSIGDSIKEKFRRPTAADTES